MSAAKSTAPSPGTVKAPLITASRKLQARADRGNLLVDRAARELARIPPGDELESVRGEHRAQRGRFARELVAELETLVTDRLALGQRYLERYLAAEPGDIVVGPRDRVDADLDASPPVIRRRSDGVAGRGRAEGKRCSPRSFSVGHLGSLGLLLSFVVLVR